MISSLYINIIHVIQLLIKYTYTLAFSVLNVNLKSCDKVIFSCTQYFGNLNVIQAEISNLMKQYWPFPEWFLYSKLISDIFKKKKTKYLRLIVFKENNSFITLNKYFCLNSFCFLLPGSNTMRYSLWKMKTWAVIALHNNVCRDFILQT